METLRYGLITKQDIAHGTGTIEVPLADGSVAILDRVNFTPGMVNLADTATGNGSTDDYVPFVNAVNEAGAQTNGGSVLLTPGDYRITASVTVPTDVTLIFLRGARLVPDDGVTVTINGTIQAGNYQIFSYGTATFTIAAPTPINPVWFTTSGNGSAASRWASSDGTAGCKKALAALQEYGSVVGPGGEYTFSAAGAVVDKDHITIQFDGRSHLVVTANVLVFNLNSGAVAGGTADNTTVVFRGGYFDGSSAGTGTGIQGHDIRNFTVESVRFRNMERCIDAAIRDTARFRDLQINGGTDAIRIPDYLTQNTPQDIVISGCSFNSGTRTFTAIRVDSRFANLKVRDNAFNLPPGSGTTIAVRLVTGTAVGDSQMFTFENNATEQATSMTLISIVTFGSSDLTGVTIRDNQFASATATFISMGRVAGHIVIEGNHFITATATAISVSSLRQQAVMFIRGNTFAQTATSSGTLWNITTASSAAKVVVGLNSYSTDVGTRTVDRTDAIMYTDLSAATSSITSAGTITVQPDSNYALVTGTTNITQVDGTGVNGTSSWAGHRITLRFNNVLTFTDGLNLILAGNLATTANDTITIQYDGTNWYEVARSVN